MCICNNHIRRRGTKQLNRFFIDHILSTDNFFFFNEFITTHHVTCNCINYVFYIAYKYIYIYIYKLFVKDFVYFRGAFQLYNVRYTHKTVTDSNIILLCTEEIRFHYRRIHIYIYSVI